MIMLLRLSIFLFLHVTNNFSGIVTLYDKRERANYKWVSHPYPFLIAYLICTSGTQQGISYLKLILFPYYDSSNDCILIQPNNVFTSCFEFMILGWLYLDMNFIVYNHDNFEIISPPLVGENSLPEAWQNYFILIFTQINVNCKFKELFICKVL